MLEAQDGRWENTISTEKAALLESAGCAASADHATEKSINPPSANSGPLMGHDNMEGIRGIVGNQRIAQKRMKTMGERQAIP